MGRSVGNMDIPEEKQFSGNWFLLLILSFLVGEYPISHWTTGVMSTRLITLIFWCASCAQSTSSEVQMNSLRALICEEGCKQCENTCMQFTPLYFFGCILSVLNKNSTLKQGHFVRPIFKFPLSSTKKTLREGFLSFFRGLSFFLSWRMLNSSKSN